jgi:hypothetical protein
MYSHGQAGILGIGDAHITYFSSSAPTNMEFVIDTYPSSVERKVDPMQKIDKEAVYETYALDDGEEYVAAAESMDPKKSVKASITKELKDYMITKQFYGRKMPSKSYRNQLCAETGLSVKQVHSWFSRPLYKKKAQKKKWT